MKSSIRKFWSELEDSVHPADRPLFDSKEKNHGFNLDFPPPAFIGDVDNAPIVILLAHGGYNDLTPSEFRRPGDRQDYIDWLTGRRAAIPLHLSGYYTGNPIYPLIQKGLAVIVNAVAYRCPHISKGDANFKLGRSLPSFREHRSWLTGELRRAAERNERFVVAHHFGLWGLERAAPPITRNFRFSTNSVSRYLSRDMSKEIDNWLGQKQ